MRYDQLLIPNGFRIEGTVTGTLPVIEYKDYLNINFLFCQNVVVKSDITNRKMNETLLLQKRISSFPEDIDSKYYLNLSGHYHFTDTLMRVRSLDTMEEIDFTVENMKYHRRTLKSYRTKNSYRLRLSQRYPNQDVLIQGILNPVNIETAIAAKDGTILSVPSDFIDEQETELLSDLQTWIYGFYFRWDVKAFNLHHSLYSLAQTSLFFIKLLERLLVLRDSKAETSQAHSFYIHQRLMSNGVLRSSIPYLTLEQKISLSRNIRYYRKFPGREYTRNKLVKTLYTKRNFPLGSLDYEKVYSAPETGLPDVQFRIQPLNEITQRDDNIVPYNELDIITGDDNTDYSSLKTSIFSASNAKWYYSNFNNYTDSLTSKYYDFVLSQWAFYANDGLMKSKLPITLGGKTLFLDSKTALWFYIILVQKLHNIKNIHFLDIEFRLAYTKKPELKYGYYYRDLEEIVNSLPMIKPIVSFEAFQVYVDELYLQYKSALRLITNKYQLEKRAIARQFINRLFDVTVLEAPAADIDTWLTENQLTIPETNEEISAVCDLLLTTHIGAYGTAFIELNEAHKEIGKLFLNLSSYSVNLVTKSNIRSLSNLEVQQPAAHIKADRQFAGRKAIKASMVYKTGVDRKKADGTYTTFTHYKQHGYEKKTTHFCRASLNYSKKPPVNYRTNKTHSIVHYSGVGISEDYVFSTGVTINNLLDINEVNIPLPVSLTTILE